MKKEYISEDTWSKILIFLKNSKGIYIGSESYCRKFIEAIYWMSRTGAQWRELHDKYGIGIVFLSDSMLNFYWSLKYIV